MIASIKKVLVHRIWTKSSQFINECVNNRWLMTKEVSSGCLLCKRGDIDIHFFLNSHSSSSGTDCAIDHWNKSLFSASAGEYIIPRKQQIFSAVETKKSPKRKKNKNNWNKSIIFRKKIPENLKVVMFFFLLKCNEFWKIKSYLKIPKNSVQILQQHVYTSYLGRKRKLVVIHLAGISQGTCRWLLMDKK